VIVYVIPRENNTTELVAKRGFRPDGGDMKNNAIRVFGAVRAQRRVGFGSTTKNNRIRRQFARTISPFITYYWHLYLDEAAPKENDTRV